MKIKSLYIFLLLTVQIISQQIINEKVICEGVVHKSILNKVDTLSINILKIDISQDQFDIITIKALNKLNAKQKTSEMIKMFGNKDDEIIAAINADFFEKDGEIINNMITEYNFVKATKFTESPYNDFVNTQFAVSSDGKLFMEKFVFVGKIVFEDRSEEQLNSINSKADSNSITLYNHYQGGFTPGINEKWCKAEFVLEVLENHKDTIICKVNGINEDDSTSIAANGYVLSANCEYANYLKRKISLNDTLSIINQFDPFINNCKSLVGGWPRLVLDGMNIINNDPQTEGIMPRFSTSQHPRTGIGFSKDSTTLYLIVVDGRQKTSRGMTLSEFAELMINEGVYQGLNLDGGGSTTMVLQNEIINKPSDKTGEREVGNCIAIIKQNK